MVSPVFLSAQTLRKLEVGISISYVLLMNYKDIIEQESMITIKNVVHEDIRCSNCSSTLLDRIGTEVYCLECETVNNVIQFETHAVPVAYESNARNRRQVDMERKLSAHIRQFICKYGTHCLEQQIKILREKLRKMKSMSPNSKGNRQAAAVVVYCSLQQIKISIADFCKQNNLKHKTFNQKYIAYHKLYKYIRHIAPSLSHQRDAGHFIKMEERVDHLRIVSQAQKERIQSEQQQQSDKLFHITLAESNKGVQIVFDDLFPNHYLKEKKQLIIQKLNTKISLIPHEFFSFIQTQTLSKPIQLYYLIFAIIKTLGYKINFQKYNDIIKKNTGYVLKKTLAFEVKKHYDDFQKRQRDPQSNTFELIEVNGIKIEDNNTQVLRIRFPVADSQNQFQYEYYFDDQFYT